MAHAITSPEVYLIFFLLDIQNNKRARIYFNNTFKKLGTIFNNII